MDREEILDLLLRNRSNDSLVERPELYSIEDDIYQGMFEERDYWNEKLSRFCKICREEGEKLKREEPEYFWRYGSKCYTDKGIRRWAWEHWHRERGRERSACHGRLACFWRSLLTARPEFVDRCPWHVFRGDNIWMALRDEDFCRALAMPKAEIAFKMPLKIMSRPDWEALLETVPELQPEYDRLVAKGYRFDAYCY